MIFLVYFVVDLLCLAQCFVLDCRTNPLRNAFCAEKSKYNTNQREGPQITETMPSDGSNHW